MRLDLYLSQNTANFDVSRTIASIPSNLVLTLKSERPLAMTHREGIRLGALAVVLALWSAIGTSTARADPIAYVTGSPNPTSPTGPGIGNEFGTIDLATGAFTQIATLSFPGFPGGDSMFGIGFGANGMLYGLDAEPNANLWQINTTTGALTLVGAVGQSADGATADANGNFYAFSADNGAAYYTLNPPSLTSNVVNGATTILNDSGLVAVNGSQLFTTDLSPSVKSVLESINPTTGAANVIGDTGYVLLAGLFAGSTLYGFDSSVDAIVTIDTSSGASTVVATYSLPNGDSIVSAALAPALVPEPSSVVLSLFGIGLAGSLGFLRNRRLGR